MTYILLDPIKLLSNNQSMQTILLVHYKGEALSHAYGPFSPPEATKALERLLHTNASHIDVALVIPLEDLPLGPKP